MPASKTARRRFPFDRLAIGLLTVLAIGLAGRAWLAENPQHDPWAPLEVAHPPGWATGMKLAALREEVTACRAVLERGEIAFAALPAAGDGECARPDRTVLTATDLTPGSPQMTCPVAVSLAIWQRQTVAPAAEELLGSPVARIEHLGTYNCRRIGGGTAGDWSEHAKGNAIDIAGFVLADGRRISVLDDWDGSGPEAAFLRRVRDGACQAYTTVLSPDYNAAHADHLHLDHAARMVGGVCR